MLDQLYEQSYEAGRNASNINLLYDEFVGFYQCADKYKHIIGHDVHSMLGWLCGAHNIDLQMYKKWLVQVGIHIASIFQYHELQFVENRMMSVLSKIDCIEVVEIINQCILFLYHISKREHPYPDMKDKILLLCLETLYIKTIDRKQELQIQQVGLGDIKIH